MANVSWNLLLTLSLFVVSCYSSFVSLNQDGGYENIVVALSPHISETEGADLITNFTNLFKDASSILYKATEDWVYFKSVTFLIPSGWATVFSNSNATYESYHRADVRVVPSNRAEDVFTTLHTNGCGQRGEYIQIRDDVFKTPIVTGSNSSHKFVQQWAKYRYGVFEENGIVGSTLYPYQYQDGGNYVKTGCAEPYPWENLSECKTDRCDFPPNNTTIPKTSLMDFDNAEGGNCWRWNGFWCSCCGHQSPQRSAHYFCNESTHKPEEPTIHNTLCNQNSVWQILKQSSDFSNFMTLSPPNVSDVTFSTVVSTLKPTFILADVLLCGEPADKVLQQTVLLAVGHFIQRILPPELNLTLALASSKMSATKEREDWENIVCDPHNNGGTSDLSESIDNATEHLGPGGNLILLVDGRNVTPEELVQVADKTKNKSQELYVFTYPPLSHSSEEWNVRVRRRDVTWNNILPGQIPDKTKYPIDMEAWRQLNAAFFDIIDKMAVSFFSKTITTFSRYQTYRTEFTGEFFVSSFDTTGVVLSIYQPFKNRSPTKLSLNNAIENDMNVEGNVHELPKTLQKRNMGRLSVLKNEHVNAILRVVAVREDEEGLDLRRFYEECQIHLRALEGLGVRTEELGVLLCPIIFQALPAKMIVEWNRKNKNQDSENLELLLEFVHEELEGIEGAWRVSKRREEARRQNNSEKEAMKKTWKREKEKSKAGGFRSTTVALWAGAATGEKNKEAKTKYCMFCHSKNHWSSGCKEIVTHQGRLEAIRDGRRCFKCFSEANFSAQCDRSITCRNCQGKHHTLLCRKALEELNEVKTVVGRKERSVPVSYAQRAAGAKEIEEIVSATAKVDDPDKVKSKEVALQTIHLWIRQGENRKGVVALLDGGSERSFICKHVVDELRLEVTEEGTVSIRSFGGNKQDKVCRAVRVPVETGGKILNLVALEVQQICHGVMFWEQKQVDRMLKKPKNANWREFASGGKPEKIDLLIGSDLYWQVVTGHMKRIGKAMMAVQTIFGWTIQGRWEALKKPEAEIVLMHTSVETRATEEVSTDELMRKLWEVDRLGGTREQDESNLTLQEVEVMKDFEEHVSFQNGRYTVGVPWKPNKEKLCGNYGMAVNRLKRLLLRLKKDAALFARYKQGMQDYVRLGHVEEVVQPYEVRGPLYYMPHQPVIHDERKTTKLRIVFDASSKALGHCSLNDCQFAGPNLNPKILNVLLRFRQHRVGIVSDVEKAFLQINLNEEDRDATRFIWVEDEELGEATPKFKIFRMTRVLFGMKASPFLLAATIRHHLRKFEDRYPEICQSIDRNTYVDDHIVGANSAEAGCRLYQQTQRILGEGGMQLKKWTTNNAKLAQRWVDEGVTDKSVISQVTKVLGLLWDTESDHLRFKTSRVEDELKEEVATKRQILGMAAGIYDPLGFLGPVVLQVKVLLQETWRANLGWDERLPEKLLQTWQKWRRGLKGLKEVTIPRWIDSATGRKEELHVFCDASQKGYGAVAYWGTYEEEKQQWKMHLIAAKSRVAPINLVSIPRLELLACVIGASLGQNIQVALGRKEEVRCTYWTDSQVTLQWISESPNRWKLFVARRIQMIQGSTRKEQWKYCTSKENPADLLSRGCTLDELRANCCWWEGPQWLKIRKEEVPERRVEEVKMNAEVEAERQNEVQMHYVAEEGSPVIDGTRFGNWKKLVRTTAWVRRFARNCRRKSQERRKLKIITKTEFEEAERYWWSKNQEENFLEEREMLKKGKEVSRQSKLRQLGPFLDRDEVIRLSGRLRWAQLTFEQKHPVILGGGTIATLIILDVHERCMHGGVQEVLVHLRSRIWILRGRQEVKRALKQCWKCRRWKCKPGAAEEASLPYERVRKGKAFSTTGVDFFGPLWVRTEKEDKKEYGCIFTCGVTRAIHLELTRSQETSDFLMALRRFLARRGNCEVIWSDNAQTFRQTDRLLKGLMQVVQQKKVQEFAVQAGITWKFIAPKAAWWGGFYERMIGTVKQHLRKTLGQEKLFEEELRTVLTEAEAVINSRPLTYISEDPAELDYLTPGLFLLQQKSTGLSCLDQTIQEFPRKEFIRRWQYQGRLLKGFWQRWTKEYLLILRSANQRKAGGQTRSIAQGDVVLIMQERMPRGSWKLARVQEVIPGRDDKIRSVLLRVASGDVIRRAIQQVCPLEPGRCKFKITFTNERDQDFFLSIVEYPKDDQPFPQVTIAADQSDPNFVVLRVSVRNNGVALLHAKVTATINNGTDNLQWNEGEELTLTDDGNNGDQLAADGIYSHFIKPNIQGPLKVEVTVKYLGHVQNAYQASKEPANKAFRLTKMTWFTFEGDINQDSIPPNRIGDLSPVSIEEKGEGNYTATFSWTAPGDDFNSGNVTKYEFKCSRTRRFVAVQDEFSTTEPENVVVIQDTKPAKETETYTWKEMKHGASYFCAVSAVDAAGNRNSPSNVVTSYVLPPTTTMSTTAPPSPTQPTDLSISTTNDTSNSLSPSKDADVTTSPSTNGKDSQKTDEAFPAYIIAIIAVSIFLLLILLAVLVWCLRFRKRKMSTAPQSPARSSSKNTSHGSAVQNNHADRLRPQSDTDQIDNSAIYGGFGNDHRGDPTWATALADNPKSKKSNHEQQQLQQRDNRRASVISEYASYVPEKENKAFEATLDNDQYAEGLQDSQGVGQQPNGEDEEVRRGYLAKQTARTSIGSNLTVPSEVSMGEALYSEVDKSKKTSKSRPTSAQNKNVRVATQV